MLLNVSIMPYLSRRNFHNKNPFITFGPFLTVVKQQLYI